MKIQKLLIIIKIFEKLIQNFPIITIIIIIIIIEV